MKAIRLVAGLALSLAASFAAAQGYPTRPITMVVPFAPGGIADVTGRPLAASMSKTLGQPILVENKAGAGGALGMAAVARAPADGYTILMALSSIVIIPEAEKFNDRKPQYQVADFVPIALISADPTVLLVPADSPWKTLGELIADAKKNPGKISYSSSGVYGTTHTALEMFAQAAGIKLLHVPYKGGGPAMTALLTGEVNITAQAPGVGDPHVRGGKVRVLASWGATRLPSIANVPTMKELGVDAEFYIWSGLFAPVGTPPAVVDKLRDAARRAARQDPDFERAMSGMNTPIAYKEGAEFQAFIDADAARLGKVIRAMGKVE